MNEPNYKKLEAAAFSLRLAALQMEQAAQKADGTGVLVAYCEIIVQLELIRNIVAGIK